MNIAKKSMDSFTSIFETDYNSRDVTTVNYNLNQEVSPLCNTDRQWQACICSFAPDVTARIYVYKQWWAVGLHICSLDWAFAIRRFNNELVRIAFWHVIPFYCMGGLKSHVARLHVKKNPNFDICANQSEHDMSTILSIFLSCSLVIQIASSKFSSFNMPFADFILTDRLN